MTSVAGDTFRLEFFANAAQDETTFSDILTVPPGEFSEGQTYIGSLDVRSAPLATRPSPPISRHCRPVSPSSRRPPPTSPIPVPGRRMTRPSFRRSFPLGGPSFVVTNTGDTGLGTLREAIYAPTTRPARTRSRLTFPPSDPRHFYYTNDGVAGQVSQSDVATTTAANDSAIANIDPDWPHSWYSIQPASSLPPLFDIDSINGYSQPGSSQNTLSAVQQGLNTVLDDRDRRPGRRGRRTDASTTPVQHQREPGHQHDRGAGDQPLWRQRNYDELALAATSSRATSSGPTYPGCSPWEMATTGSSSTLLPTSRSAAPE